MKSIMFALLLKNHFRRFNDMINQDKDLPLVLPYTRHHRRVCYSIMEYDPLLDSSNMTMDDWIQIAKGGIHKPRGQTFWVVLDPPPIAQSYFVCLLKP